MPDRLDAWDLAELDAYAASVARLGNHRAATAYHQWAIRRGWHGTPAWIAGRSRFRIAHRAARRAQGQPAPGRVTA